MSLGRVAWLMAILGASPAFAEFDYCYTDPPEGVTQTDTDAATNPFFGFEYAMMPWAAKSICGLDVADEVATVRRAYQTLGCTQQSEVGQQFEAELANTDAVTIKKAVIGGAAAPDLTTPEWQAFCAVAADIQLLDAQFKDDASLTDDDKMMIEQMEPLWRRLFEISETLPRD